MPDEYLRKKQHRRAGTISASNNHNSINGKIQSMETYFFITKGTPGIPHTSPHYIIPGYGSGRCLIHHNIVINVNLTVKYL
jgi:hypothetical protein